MAGEAGGLPLALLIRPPTPTTRPCWRRSWTISHRSGCRAGGDAGDPPKCMPTRPCATRRCVTGWEERTHRSAVAAAQL